MQRGEEGRGAEYEQSKLGSSIRGQLSTARAVLTIFSGRSASKSKAAKIPCKTRSNRSPQQPQRPPPQHKHPKIAFNTDSTSQTHTQPRRLENVRLNSTPLLSIPSSPHLTILLIKT